MPIVNASQARIELSESQAESFAHIVNELMNQPGSLTPPMIYIEETNLGSTVVVGGKGMPMTLIHHDGETHAMAVPAQKPKRGSARGD